MISACAVQGNGLSIGAMLNSALKSEIVVPLYVLSDYSRASKSYRAEIADRYASEMVRSAERVG